MKEIRIEETTKLADILKILKEDPEAELEITNPNTDLFKSVLNKRVVEKAAEELGKKLKFRPVHIQNQKADAVETKGPLDFVEGKDVAQEPIQETSGLPNPPAGEEKKKLNVFKLPKIKGKKWLIIPLVAVPILIVIISLLVWFIPSATVKLQTANQFKEAEEPLVASLTAKEVDSEKGVIPLKSVEVEESDSIESKSTGSKTIGDPAKGRVSIINRDQEEKNFFGGTLIVPVSGTKIQFSLDTDVTVAASPEGCGAPPSPACQEKGVDVTAKNIGVDGNLPAGTVFRVGSASTLEVTAVNGTNFSGGTSKQITVISVDDHKKAKEDLLKTLTDKAKKDLKDKNPGIVIAEGALESQILDETYTNKVDEEAANFRLNLRVKFSAKAVLEKDLEEVLKKSILADLKGNFELDSKNTTLSMEILEKNPDSLKIIGKIKAALTPIIDKNEILNNIKGRDFSSVDKYLKSQEEIAGFEVIIRPRILQSFGMLPFNKGRITIELVSSKP